MELLFTLFIVHLLLQLLDILTTYIGVVLLKAKELNPFVDYMLKKYGVLGMLTIKNAGLLVFTLLNMFVPYDVAIVNVTLANSFMALIVFINTINIFLALRRR